MDKQPRILIIPSWYPPDGGYFFKEHSESVAGLGYQVDVLVKRLVGIRKLISLGLSALKASRMKHENGLRVFRSVYLKIPGNEERNIRGWSNGVLKSFTLYQEQYGKPDLILAHSVTWAGYASSLISKKFGVPYLVVEHRSFFVWSTAKARKMVKPFYLPYFEEAFRNCETVVPVSASLMPGLTQLMPWIADKTKIIPNMIREDMFLPPEKVREADPFIFFWAGRLEHVKGIDVLLQSVKLLKEEVNSDFRLRLAGKGSLRDELESLSVDLGLGNEVTFLGRISREEMQKEMQEANCFVLPTRYEAFGVVLIEAMASGLPVIATRSGGPDSIIKQENGLLVDVENDGQLAAAMKQMIAEYKSYSSSKLRQNTIEEYGQTAVMKRYQKCFQEILHK